MPAVTDDLTPELERVFDVVEVTRTPAGRVYKAAYWEGDVELNIEIDVTLKAVFAEMRRAGERTMSLVPVEQTQVRTASKPWRVDFDKSFGGRLTLWFHPVGYSIGGEP